jgi:hypothetical protein
MKLAANNKTSFLVTLIIALVSFIFFAVYFDRSAVVNKAKNGEEKPESKTKDLDKLSEPINIKNSEIEEHSLDDSHVEELKDSFPGQIGTPSPILPEDLREQLGQQNQPLPEDLKEQLNSPTPELPEDIKKALATPPRIVTEEEVNSPSDER